MSSAGEFPTLGFNPAPGDVESVHASRESLGKTHRHISEAVESLQAVSKPQGIWEGEAAAAFHGKVGDVGTHLTKLQEPFAEAASAVQSWEDDLTHLQQRAREYEQQAQQAQQQVQAARNDPALDLAGQTFASDEALQAAQSRYEEAARCLRLREEELEEIRKLAKRLYEEHQQLAREIARKIERAVEDSGIGEPLDLNPEVAEKVLQALVDAAISMRQFLESNTKLLKDISGFLYKAGTFIATGGMALGALIGSFAFPGLGTAIGGAAGAAIGFAIGAVFVEAGLALEALRIAVKHTPQLPDGYGVDVDLGATAAAESGTRLDSLSAPRGFAGPTVQSTEVVDGATEAANTSSGGLFGRNVTVEPALTERISTPFWESIGAQGGVAAALA